MADEMSAFDRFKKALAGAVNGDNQRAKYDQLKAAMNGDPEAQQATANDAAGMAMGSLQFPAGFGMGAKAAQGAEEASAALSPLQAQKQAMDAAADTFGAAHPEARIETSRFNKLMDLMKRNPSAQLPPRR